MNIESKHITAAYLKLKRFVYYDKTNLNLRHRLAEFECDTSFQNNLRNVLKVINSDNPLQTRAFKSWLNEISFRVVPKSFQDSKVNVDDDGRFISNVTSEKEFCVEKVNYFFDGPIELHLISVLWIMFEGQILDRQLGTECYGARLEEGLDTSHDQSARLFRRYHELYARWRDSGIRKAKHLLTEEKTSICILGLDVQEYYYHIRLDFQKIAQSIYKNEPGDNGKSKSKVTPSTLLKCLEAICVEYQKQIAPLHRITHEHISPNTTGLPIGLCSSPLLANWYLRDFDKAVKKFIRPAYYGRYVDDILLVIPTEDDLSKEKSPVSSFINRLMVKTGILFEPHEKRYEIANPEGLFLQLDKCILQYFDSNHSIAGLEKFQKKLEENGSDFLLMPVDETGNSLEDIAYELLYDGSVNKFRSVQGLTENRYELAKHLAKQTILLLLTDDPPDPKIKFELQKFFKGKNAIKFHDLWERVLTFHLIANDSKAVRAFTKHLQSQIKHVCYKDQSSITEHLVSNLKEHLALALDMAKALGELDLLFPENDQSTVKNIFRHANLIRHHFVRIPLLNYTTYSGSLTSRSFKKMVKVDSHKLELSPRYVNFDECLLLADSRDVALNKNQPFQWAQNIYKMINGHEVDQGIEWISIEVNEKDVYD
ncbi:MAG: RNA-directed DNA polymerase [Thermodesulfovibrionia bacterium]|nr:RNA-directed DNA polymerase [Thermodesulfovibrionia bacterium]